MRLTDLFKTSALASLCLTPVLLVGCAADRGMNVPGSARLAASGNGELSYNAPSDGMIYVYDRGNDQLVWSGPVMRGQLFTLDRDHDRLTVDGRVVQDKTPNITNEHKVFFDSGASGGSRTETRTETIRTGPAY